MGRPILELGEFGVEGGRGFDVFEIFGGGGQAFVTDDLRQIKRIQAGGQLVGYKSVAQVINFDGFDTGVAEIAVDGGSDISD